MKKPAFILDPEAHITITFDDGIHETIYTDDDRFDELLTAIKDSDWQVAHNIVNKKATVIDNAVTTLNVDGGVRIEHGVVYVNDQPMHTTLTDRMIKMAEAGFDITPMTKFLTNLLNNPSFRAVHQLYDFMEKSQLPITDDGHFLAYKRINSDYTDCHTGKMDNSIGATVEMPRYLVNDNRDDTCSTGLHFCARSYLSFFGGDRIVVVKINPADVVSIPSDYNNAKGRACKYVIIQEIENEVVSESPLETLSVAAVPASTTTVIEQTDPINQDHLIMEHSSVDAAAEHTGIRAEYIERVISGDRRSTGGYGWRKVEKRSISYDLTATVAHDDSEYGDDEDAT